MERSPKSDLFGGIILIIAIILSVSWIFNDTYTLILAIIALFIGFSTILYVKRVMAIELEFRNPLADSLIVLSGITSTLNLLSGWVDTFNSIISGIFNSFNFWISISMFVAGILIKVLLLDRVLMETLRKIRDSIKYIINWTTGGVNNFIRLVLMIIGISSYLFQEQFDTLSEFLTAKVIMFSSFSLVLLLSSNRRWRTDIEYFIFRSITGVVALVFLGLEGRSLAYSNIELILNTIFLVSVIVWSISLPTLYSYSRATITYIPKLVKSIFESLKRLFKSIITWISVNILLTIKIFAFVLGIVLFAVPSIYEVPVIDISANLIIGILLLIFTFSSQISSLLKFLSKGIKKLYENIKIVISDILTWINLNKKLATQLSLGIASFLSYFLIEPSKIDPINLDLNVLIALILLFSAILPTVIDFLRWLYPYLVTLFNIIREYITNPSKLFFTLAVLTTIIPEFIPDLPKYIYLKVGLYIVAGILYAISWQNLMIFIDRLHLIIYKFLSIFTKLFRFITQFMSWRAYMSISSWIVLFIAIFLRSWVNTSNTVYFQLSLFLLAFILWISPYPHRWKKLRNFVRNLFHRLYKLLRYLFEVLIENIILLVLWILAGIFMITGIGLFLPDPFEITKYIFSGVIDNLMVSIIIGIFLVGLSVLTIRESYRNREKFHLEVIR